MPTKVTELADRSMRGDRNACPLCRVSKPDEVSADVVWTRSLALANGKPALKR